MSRFLKHSVKRETVHKVDGSVKHRAACTCGFVSAEYWDPHVAEEVARGHRARGGGFSRPRSSRGYPIQEQLDRLEKSLTAARDALGAVSVTLGERDEHRTRTAYAEVIAAQRFLLELRGQLLAAPRQDELDALEEILSARERLSSIGVNWTGDAPIRRLLERLRGAREHAGTEGGSSHNTPSTKDLEQLRASAWEGKRPILEFAVDVLREHGYTGSANALDFELARTKELRDATTAEVQEHASPGDATTADDAVHNDAGAERQDGES